MENPIGKGVDWLVARVRELDVKARAEQGTIEAATKQIAHLRAVVLTIKDPAKRAARLADVVKLEKRQGQIVSFFRNTVQRYESIKAQAVSWMRAHGVLKQFGLSGVNGLGAVQVAVPVVVGIGVLGIFGAVALVHEWNLPHVLEIKYKTQVAEAEAKGQIASGTTVALAEQESKKADAAAKKADPFGQVASAIVTAALIGGGIYAGKLLLAQQARKRTERERVAA